MRSSAFVYETLSSKTPYGATFLGNLFGERRRVSPRTEAIFSISTPADFQGSLEASSCTGRWALFSASKEYLSQSSKLEMARQRTRNMSSNTHPGTSSSATGSGLPAPARAPRSFIACVNCRRLKAKCVQSEHPPRSACARCARRGLTCEYPMDNLSSYPYSEYAAGVYPAQSASGSGHLPVRPTTPGSARLPYTGPPPPFTVPRYSNGDYPPLGSEEQGENNQYGGYQQQYAEYYQNYGGQQQGGYYHGGS
ncbi:C6 finger domain [Mycena chlorophos]|uniref:C6 finger domain n=1 Tax=Mycena chlorophos TaxID=658473 RepID=A0A8H6WJG8_MYCCL|nr:C6 finger domain [Mycena chlorophos]